MGLTHQLKLIRAAYGLNDAPRLWRLRLDQHIRSVGGKVSAHDECVYFFYDKLGKLCGVLSTHVDDIKGCGSLEWRKEFLEGLEKTFGKCTIKTREFDHCGIAHV